MIQETQLMVITVIIGQSLVYYYVYEGLEYEFCKIIAPKFLSEKC